VPGQGRNGFQCRFGAIPEVGFRGIPGGSGSAGPDRGGQSDIGVGSPEAFGRCDVEDTSRA